MGVGVIRGDILFGERDGMGVGAWLGRFEGLGTEHSYYYRSYWFF
jgi:hypothetical protein